MIGKTNSVIVSGGSSENTLKKLLDTTKSCYYLFYNYRGTSVDDLIQPSDTENVTNMNHMFQLCINLTTIPLLDTSKVTTMNSMFYSSLITTVPLLNTSNVKEMSATFQSCSKLTTVPLFDTSNVKNMSYMFNCCSALTSIPQFNTSNVTNMSSMFYQCKALTSIPQLNTSNVTNMSYMFQYCTNLTTVPALDANKVTDMGNMFYGCSKLKSILMTNIGVNLDIHASTKFEREDLLVILNNLKTVTSSKKLTMGSTNLAKLTEEDKAIATNKG